jgi:hypothetical protein
MREFGYIPCIPREDRIEHGAERGVTISRSGIRWPLRDVHVLGRLATAQQDQPAVRGHSGVAVIALARDWITIQKETP